MTKLTENEIEAFRELLSRPRSPKIYYVLRRVSKSGMSRVISFYYFSEDGQCYCLDQLISQLAGFTYNEKLRGVRVHGTGMNMVWYCLMRMFERLLGATHGQNFDYYGL